LKRRTLAGVGLLTAVNAALLGAHLGSKSIWIDEALGVKTARIRSIAAAYARYRSNEVQPPLNNVLLWIWARIAGTSDAVMRVPSVVLTVACVPLVFLLARRLVGRRPAWVATYLFAISPFVLLFGRMSLYYMPTLFLALCSALTLIAAFERGRWWWALHAGAGALLLLTNYTAAAYLVVETIVGGLVVFGKMDMTGDLLRSVRQRRAWFASAAAVAAAFAAWLAIDRGRLFSTPISRPRAAEILGVPRLVLDAAYPVFAWTLGPTIFPWRLVGAVATVAAVVALVAGAVAVLRSRRYFVAAASVGVVAITVVAYQVYVKGRPFETIPTRAIAAFPFVLMVAACGVTRLGRAGGAVVLALLTAGYGLGAANYFTNREFHNAIYAVPSRDIARDIVSRAQPGDVVVVQDDSEVQYYLASTPRAPCTVRLNASSLVDAAALRALQSHSPSRVWTVMLGRDGSQGRIPAGTTDWIGTTYELAATRGYAPQDATYAAIKRRIEGTAYRYKAVLRLFDRPRIPTSRASCELLQPTTASLYSPRP